MHNSNPRYDTGLEAGDQKHVSKVEGEPCIWRTCGQVDCKKPWHQQDFYWKCREFVEKLKPIVYFTGTCQIILGVLVGLIVVAYAESLDLMFGATDLKLISILSLSGLMLITIAGMMLIIALAHDRRFILWLYLFISTFMCIYIFVLAMMMIQFSLYRTPVSIFERGNYLNKPCVIGIGTLLCSVVHFVDTLVAFTYYNLHYIHPEMFGVDT